MRDNFSVCELCASFVVCLVVAVYIAYYAPRASANPVASIPDTTARQWNENTPLSEVLRDLTDQSRGGEWGRVIVWDPSGENRARILHALGRDMPGFGASTSRFGLFGRTRVTPEIAEYLNQVEAGAGDRMGRRGVPVFGTEEGRDQDGLWLLGARYLVTCDDFESGPKSLRYSADPRESTTPRVKHSRGKNGVSFESVTWPGWSLVHSSKGFHVYSNVWTLHRVQFQGYPFNLMNHKVLSVEPDGLTFPSIAATGPLLFGDDINLPHDWTTTVQVDQPGFVRISTNIFPNKMSASSEHNYGYLFFNEPLAEKWAAQIDGQVVPILPVNGVLMAIQLGPGEHTVEFRYRYPPSGPIILPIVAATLLVILIAGLLYLRSERKAMYGTKSSPDTTHD